MNMRQHKRWVMARQLAPWGLVFIGRRILDRSRVTPIQIVDETPSALGELLLRKIREDEIQRTEEAKQEFVCKKRNGEVVAVFDTREDALALMLKHIKQKKAKLDVMDSSTGELVIFSEEEMA